MNFVDIKCLENLLIEGEYMIVTEGIGSAISGIAKRFFGMITGFINTIIGIFRKLINKLRGKKSSKKSNSNTGIRSEFKVAAQKENIPYLRAYITSEIINDPTFQRNICDDCMAYLKEKGIDITVPYKLNPSEEVTTSDKTLWDKMLFMRKVEYLRRNFAYDKRIAELRQISKVAYAEELGEEQANFIKALKGRWSKKKNGERFGVISETAINVLSSFVLSICTNYMKVFNNTGNNDISDEVIRELNNTYKNASEKLEDYISKYSNSHNVITDKNKEYIIERLNDVIERLEKAKNRVDKFASEEMDTLKANEKECINLVIKLIPKAQNYATKMSAIINNCEISE